MLMIITFFIEKSQRVEIITRDTTLQYVFKTLQKTRKIA